MNDYTINHLAEVLEAGERPPRSILLRFVRDLGLNDSVMELYRLEAWAELGKMVRQHQSQQV